MSLTMEPDATATSSRTGLAARPLKGTIAGAVYVALLLTQAFASDTSFAMGGLRDLAAEPVMRWELSARHPHGEVPTMTSLARVPLPPQSVGILYGQSDPSKER